MPVMSLTVFALTFFLLALGIPVAVGLGLASLFVFFVFRPVPLQNIPLVVWSGVESFVLVAVPFFMLAGALMETGGVGKRLYNFCNALFSWMRGGFGTVNIVASMIFGGISGSSLADIASLGPIEIHLMVENGYDIDYSAALTACSATLAVIIPPSILLVVVGVLAEQSIAALLLGGIVPGLFITLLMCLVNYYLCVKNNIGNRLKFSFSFLLKSLKEGMTVLLAPAILLGGIISGIVTPTEAAALAVFYILFITTFVHRELSFKDFIQKLIYTGRLTSAIMLIVASSTLFTWITTWEGLAEKITTFLLSISTNRYVILLMFNILFLIVGMFIDVMCALIVLTDLLFPIAIRVGIDPIHFGVIMVGALAIGLVTPPYGVCLFATATVVKRPLERIIKASLPFILSLIIALFLYTYIPSLVLFLPHLLLKR